MIINQNIININKFPQNQNFGRKNTIQRYLVQVRKEDLLPHETVVSLVNQMRAGDKTAKEKLVKGNKKLVEIMAKRYTHLGTLAREDLIQEGLIGLSKAIDRFDLNRGCHLVTYAPWWIRQAMNLAIKKFGHQIRITRDMLDDIVRFKEVRRKLINLSGKTPSIERLSEDTGFTPKYIERIKAAMRVNPKSLDSPPHVYDDEPNLLSKRLKDDSVDVFETVAAQELKVKISKLLSKLSPKQRTAVIMHLGLGGGEEMTLESIAQQQGCRYQAVQQAFNNGFAKLKQLAQERGLQEFLPSKNRSQCYNN